MTFKVSPLRKSLRTPTKALKASPSHQPPGSKLQQGYSQQQCSDRDKRTYSKRKTRVMSSHGKKLFMEFGLEDSYSCSNIANRDKDYSTSNAKIMDTEVTSSRNRNAFRDITGKHRDSEFESSLGLVLSESSEEDDKTDVIPSSQTKSYVKRISTRRTKKTMASNKN